MKPIQFENIVCEYYRKKNYQVKTTPASNDYGVDVFAIKAGEKIAIQAKMYGGGRKINRKMIMELHGAKDYFDCSRAVLATNGVLLEDAASVAKKLKIEILYIDGSDQIPIEKQSNSDRTFDAIWEKYIIPLQGKTLTRANGDTNKILKVNWSEVERITTKGNSGKIEIEIFKQTVSKLLTEAFITRDYINQNYVGRASSGVILILSQVPFFQITEKPMGLKYNK